MGRTVFLFPQINATRPMKTIDCTRVREMEAAYVKAREAVDSLLRELDNHEGTLKDIAILRSYQESGQWLKDFEADERGEIPKDVPRGVLSEDGLDTLLEDAEYLRSRLEALSKADGKAAAAPSGGDGGKRFMMDVAVSSDSDASMLVSLTRDELEEMTWLTRENPGMSEGDALCLMDSRKDDQPPRDKRLFVPFDPNTDYPSVIPGEPGNYLVTLREGCTLPGIGADLKYRSWSDFKDMHVVYTGMSEKSLRKRITHDHLKGHSAFSTLRISLGCLLGFKLVPRDKVPDGRHWRFSTEDEAALSKWMRENLMFHYRRTQAPDIMERALIVLHCPPLNLDAPTGDTIYKEFQAKLKELRGRHA